MSKKLNYFRERNCALHILYYDGKKIKKFKKSSNYPQISNVILTGSLGKGFEQNIEEKTVFAS